MLMKGCRFRQGSHLPQGYINQRSDASEVLPVGVGERALHPLSSTRLENVGHLETRSTRPSSRTCTTVSLKTWSSFLYDDGIRFVVDLTCENDRLQGGALLMFRRWSPRSVVGSCVYPRRFHL